jgi:peptide/nickel transport system substrate-binding protein
MSTIKNRKTSVSRRDFLRLTALGAGGTVLVACTPPAQPTNPPAPAQAAQPAAPAVKELDTLKIGLAAMLQNFDPGYGIGIASIKIFYNIFDTLLQRDKKGNIAGQLATEWKQIDDKTLNLTIRKGVTFHNGEACTSEDIKFTFDRILGGYGDGTIKVLYESLDSVSIIDDYTVQFKTKYVDAAFYDRLGSIWGTHIVPKDYVTKVGDTAFQTAPIGTGPYQMTSYSPEKIVLTRYDKFWGEKPPIRQIEFRIMPESSSRVAALLTGEVDMVNDIFKDQMAKINNTKGFKVMGTSVKNIHIYVFNTKNGPMANQKFRQALAAGINRQQLVDTLFGPYALVPNGHQFKSYGDYYISEYPNPKYDLEAARKLVQESGYDGSEIELKFRPNYYTNGNQAGEAIIDMWSKIGIKAKLNFDDKYAVKDIKHVGAWSSASRFDDPLGALWLLFGTGSVPANNHWDLPPEWLKLGEQLKTNKDKTTRRAQCAELLKMWDTIAPGTYLYQVEDLYGVRDGFEWDMTYAQNQIMPFRAGDFKLI